MPQEYILQRKKRALDVHLQPLGGTLALSSSRFVPSKRNGSLLHKSNQETEIEEQDEVSEDYI
jgi:hypothetical protein